MKRILLAALITVGAVSSTAFAMSSPPQAGPPALPVEELNTLNNETVGKVGGIINGNPPKLTAAQKTAALPDFYELTATVSIANRAQLTGDRVLFDVTAAMARKQTVDLCGKLGGC